MITLANVLNCNGLSNLYVRLGKLVLAKTITPAKARSLCNAMERTVAIHMAFSMDLEGVYYSHCLESYNGLSSRERRVIDTTVNHASLITRARANGL